MDHSKNVSSEQQQHDDQQVEHLPVIDESEGRPKTVVGQHQHSHLQEQRLLENPESLVYQEEQVQDSEEQQRNSGRQTKEKCKEPDYQGMLKEESKEMQAQKIRELQAQQHQNSEAPLKQEVPMQIDSQDLKAQQSQEMPTQQSQEIEAYGGRENPPLQNKDQSPHHHKEEQTQHTLTAGQAHPSLSDPRQHQRSLSTHNQKQQVSGKDVQKQQQQQQDQQCKKLKKKLVGENQERINFLVQASQAMALKAESRVAIPDQRALAAQLGSLASAVGRRCVLRLAPALKRCLCKGCGTALVYGLNARVRHRSRRQKHMVVTCLTCHTIKRFINDPQHRLWFEQKEALM